MTVDQAIAALRKVATKATRDGMARFAIPADNAFGVRMGDIHKLAKRIGKDHELAAELWKSGWYEARLLAAYVDAPKAVTPAQMDAWSRDFGSWAVCDTACFALFSRTTHAWPKLKRWAIRKDEFIRRAAFALLASMTLRDKQADDAVFIDSLKLISKAANDERNFVKKSVNWALRSIGKKNATLNAAAIELCHELAASEITSARWIGKDALRELSSEAVQRRLKAKANRRAIKR